MAGVVRLGNGIAVTAIALALAVAFFLQFVLNELPCPLCNLQRVALALCGFGFLLNLRFGVQPMHYGLSLLAALFGAAASGRQVLLHVLPGSGAYGSALLGLHLYAWSFVAFVAIIAGIALLMILGGQAEAPWSGRRSGMGGLSRLAAWLLVALTLANAVNSFLLCGPIECADDPAGYWIARHLP
ncbi:MAG: disulfide bond formation protein B [Pseudomonadota bacterium]